MEQGFPHGEKIRPADSEHLNRHAANRCTADKNRPRPLEMFAPRVRTRVKEPDEFARVWISARYVRTLMATAMQAGEGEIFRHAAAAMQPRDNMIDVNTNDGGPMASFGEQAGPSIS